MKCIILTEEIFSELQNLLNRTKQNCKQCEELFIKLTPLSFDVIDKNGNSMKKYLERINAE